MKRKKRRNNVAILLAISIFITMYSLVWWSGVSLPYPDPTPELLREQENNIRIASYFIKAGVFGIGCSIIGLVIQLFRRVKSGTLKK